MYTVHPYTTLYNRKKNFIRTTVTQKLNRSFHTGALAVAHKVFYTRNALQNERYIPEHQNKLNIYDLQNYEFFANFFNRKMYSLNSLNFKNE